MKHIKNLVTCLTFGLITFGFAPAVHAQYRVVDLGANVTPLAFNNQGHLLESVYDQPTMTNSLFLWQNGMRQLVGTGLRDGHLNEIGQVAAIDSAGNIVVWQNGTMQTIAPFSTSYYDTIAGFSDHGNIVWNKNRNGYLYTGGAVQNIGPYHVSAVNDSGQVVGDAYDSNAIQSAYFYKNGVWSLFYAGRLPTHYGMEDYGYGDQFSGTQAAATKINNEGDVLTTLTNYPAYTPLSQPVRSAIYSASSNSSVEFGIYDILTALGLSRNGDVAFTDSTISTYHSDSIPVLYFQGNTYKIDSSLMVYSTHVSSIAYAFNDNGQVVGRFYDYPNFTTFPNGRYYLFLYDVKTDSNVDLQNLAGLPSDLYVDRAFINNASQIVLDTGGENYLLLPVPAVKISGKVTLLDCVGSAVSSQPITFLFRQVNGPTLTRSVNLQADGSYIIENSIGAGQYSVAIKGSKWLQSVKSLDTTQGAVSNFDVTLSGGDANNDNRVDLSDFSLLVNAWGTTYNANNIYNGYDARADFNCDSTVDLTDFGVLLNSYGLTGDL